MYVRGHCNVPKDMWTELTEVCGLAFEYADGTQWQVGLCHELMTWGSKDLTQAPRTMSSYPLFSEHA